MNIDKKVTKKTLLFSILLLIGSFVFIALSFIKFSSLSTILIDHAIKLLLTFFIVFISLNIFKIREKIIDKALLITSVNFLLSTLVLFLVFVVGRNLGESAVAYIPIAGLGFILIITISILVIKKVCDTSIKTAVSIALCFSLISYVLTHVISGLGILHTIL